MVQTFIVVRCFADTCGSFQVMQQVWGVVDIMQALLLISACLHLYTLAVCVFWDPCRSWAFLIILLLLICLVMWLFTLFSTYAAPFLSSGGSLDICAPTHAAQALREATSMAVQDVWSQAIVENGKYSNESESPRTRRRCVHRLW